MVTVRNVLRGRSRLIVTLAVGILLLSTIPTVPARVVADALPFLPAAEATDAPPTATDIPPTTTDVPPTAMDAPSDVVIPPDSSPPPVMEPTPIPVPIAPPPAGVPTHILIPSVGINAAVEVVGLEPDGSMGTPKNFDNTGWYQYSVRPGDQGTAVIDGHVDSAVLNRGTVFWNLRNVKVGDIITVIGDDSVARHFSVTSMQQITPQTVPPELGPSDGVHLTLITCDSTTPFNRRTHEYGGWVLVTADAM